eukprot:365574-Chlamydomonas_euryale.AAC.1
MWRIVPVASWLCAPGAMVCQPSTEFCSAARLACWCVRSMCQAGVSVCEWSGGRGTGRARGRAGAGQGGHGTGRARGRAGAGQGGHGTVYARRRRQGGGRYTHGGRGTEQPFGASAMHPRSSAGDGHRGSLRKGDQRCQAPGKACKEPFKSLGKV